MEKVEKVGMKIIKPLKMWKGIHRTIHTPWHADLQSREGVEDMLVGGHPGNII